MAGVMVAGTREPSAAGALLARYVGRRIAEMGVTLIVGGAPGIDTEALLGAIEAGGQILLVLPWVNPAPFKHIDEILKRARHVGFHRYHLDNAVILVRATAFNKPRLADAAFKARTELAVEEADAVVVVEAKTPKPGRGWGTYYAVKYAVRRGKHVYILEPSVDDQRVRDAFNILTSLGAKPVRSIDEVLVRIS